MTTVYLSDKLCFICGEKSKYPMGNLSLGNVSVRDLDGRPTLILRSSVYLWIQRCPLCGYCAPEIAEGTDTEKQVVKSEEYLKQLDDAAFPETANSFLCHGIFMRSREQYADAAWAAVFASWICDDNGYSESAHTCRGKAIELFTHAREHSQKFADSMQQEQIYFIDLYRRRSQFDIASRLCDKALEEEHTDRILDLLYLERDLINNRDSAAHSEAEADDPNV
ncbi:MAG: hypothetical protein JW863_24090 [Chitinispirillaceae bacterium]|nr:hypothetical protein [Chitinispirillaceae bacterium]